MTDKLIEFKENGFIDNYNNCFYAYQSIYSINDIRTIEDDTVHFKTIVYGDPLDNAVAYKQMFFKVTLANNLSLNIGYYYKINFYEKILRKNKFMKYLFGDFKYVKNRQIEKFYTEKTEQMKIDEEILKQTRNELIKKFNEWKEN